MKGKVENKSDRENEWLKLRSEKCCKCEKEFQLTFSFAFQNYSLKNSCFYWTGKNQDKEKYICSPCLRRIYSNLDQRKEFLKTVESSKKSHLRSYISRNIIS